MKRGILKSTRKNRRKAQGTLSSYYHKFLYDKILLWLYLMTSFSGDKVLIITYMLLSNIIVAACDDLPSQEIKLEWGKGLAQKREAEAERVELELEKDRPFARSR